MTTTIELARACGVTTDNVFSEEALDRFRALIVAERDKELMGVGLEPVAYLTNKEQWLNDELWPDDCFARQHCEGSGDEAMYTAEQFTAARLQDQQRIAELEANLKRATAALAERKPSIDDLINSAGILATDLPHVVVEKLQRVMDAKLANRNPLTDEQILQIACGHYNPNQRPEISFARAIEDAHGIKEPT